jgi:hypothetical protein
MERKINRLNPVFFEKKDCILGGVIAFKASMPP